MGSSPQPLGSMGRNGGCAATLERAVGAGANCRTPQTLWKTMWKTLTAPVDNAVDKAAVSWTAHVLGTGQQAHSRDVVPPVPCGDALVFTWRSVNLA